MIKQLLKLLETCTSVNILAVKAHEGKLSLTFIPTAKQDGDAAMATPFNLTGTPDELESGIALALDKINGSRATLAEQVEATNTLLAQATKEATEKGRSALASKSGKPAPVQTSSTDTTNDGDTEDDEDDPVSDGQRAPNAAPAVTPVSAMNLFA